MSGPSHSGHGGGTDNLHDMALGKIVLVGLVSLVIFAAGVLWAYFLLVGKERELAAVGSATPASQMYKEEIGIVDQVPFDVDRRLDVIRATQAKRLSHYGWVDRAKGIARMPIEKAMEQVVAQPPDIAEEGVPPAARVPAPVPEPVAPPPASGRGRSGRGAEGAKP